MRLRIEFFLLLCLVLAGCRGAVGTHSRIDPAMTAFIPPDTLALAGVRVDQLRATPLYRKLAGTNRLPRFDEFRSETGIDPERDVRELLLANDGKNSLLIARGTFEAKAPASVKTSVYQGYTLFGDGENAVFTLIGKTIVLAGRAAVVRAAIDRHKGGRHDAPAALLARAEALPGDAQVWAAANGWTGFPPEMLPQMGNAANLNRVLQSVEDASMSADLRVGVRAAATGDCRTAQDAKTLSESLRGLVGLGRLSVPENQSDLLRTFDGIQVMQDGRSVKIEVDIPQDLADQLVGKLR